MPSLYESVPSATGLEEALAFLESNRRGYQGAVVHLAAVKTAGTWQSALWSLRAVAIQDVAPQRKEWRYSSLLLLQEPLELDGIGQLLAGVFEHGSVLDIDAKLSSTQGNTARRRILHANNEHADHSGMAWIFDGASKPTYPSGPLVEFGAPYICRADAAIADWVGIRDWHGSADARLGAGIVYLPETRASFESFVRPGDTTLEKRVRRSSWFSPAIRIKGEGAGDVSRCQRRDVP